MVIDDKALPFVVDKAKDQYNEQFDRKKTLEGKANNITTIAGTVAALLFGLGQFLVGKLIDLHYAHLSEVVFILIIGASLSIAAILFSVIGFRIQKFKFTTFNLATNHPASTTEASYVNNLKSKPTLADNDRLNKLKSKPTLADNDGLSNLMREYLVTYNECISCNTLENHEKAGWIELSQWFFFSSVFTIPFLLVMLYLYP